MRRAFPPTHPTSGGLRGAMLLREAGVERHIEKVEGKNCSPHTAHVEGGRVAGSAMLGRSGALSESEWCPVGSVAHLRRRESGEKWRVKVQKLPHHLRPAIVATPSL